MNLWFLAPLIACIININLCVYIASISKQKKLSISYCLFALTIASWEALDFMMWLPAFPDSGLDLAIKISSIFWIPLVFMLLHFIYMLTQKKRDLVYYIFLAIVICFITVSQFTDLIISSGRRETWGIFSVPGPFYLTTVFFIAVFPGTYAIATLFKFMLATNDPLQRKQYSTIVLGLILTFIACIISGPIFVSLTPEKSFPILVSSFFTIQSFFIVFAMIHHNFLNIDVAESAYEIFSKIHDGVIIVDRDQRISSINKAAAGLFNINKDASKKIHIEDLGLDSYYLGDYYADREVTIDTKKGKRVALVSRNPLMHSKEISGNLLIFKDISERKTAEQEIMALNQKLEERIEDRTKKLKHARNEILQQEHKSELADITTGTLHNVKNILNSVKTSSEIAMNILSGNAIKGYKKANQLLKENVNTIESFICNNPKGKKLMEYYLKLEDAFDMEGEESRKHLTRVMEKVNAIESIITVQQGYGGSSLMEEVNIADVLEDAVIMQMESITGYGIRVKKEIEDVPPVNIQKTKFMHILVNLIKNAREAMFETKKDARELGLKVEQEESSVVIKVSDTGTGISPENQEKLFTHGFTTKDDGHGFGLYSCANYMAEMGGKMWAESRGIDKGATFVLRLPVPDSLSGTVKNKNNRTPQIP